MADLIDRQAAIDVICTEGCGMCAEVLKDIPAAARWIPVSEGLPEFAGVYLCTIQSGEHYSVMMCTWRPTLHMWMPLMYGNHDNVIAWQPLPEPYRKEGNDGA